MLDKAIPLSLVILSILITAPLRADDINPLAQGKAPPLRFDTYTLNDDPNYLGGEVAHFLIPAGWKVDGGVDWDLSNTFPAQVNIRISDPNSSASFGTYPLMNFFWSNDNRAFPPGTKYGGALVRQPPQDQFDAAATVFIPQFRKELAHAKIVETEKLPKLSEVIFKNNPTLPGTTAMVESGRIRYEYEINHQAVQEDVYIVYILKNHTRLGSQNWALENITSIRGPKGKLDDLKEMHDVMMRSSAFNMNWYNQYSQLLQTRFNKEIVASLRAGEAARKQAHQAEQISDTIKQNYENLQKSNDQISEARAETTRGQTPWQEPDGSKVLLPAEYGHAWRDDNGQYIVTNDSQYNPNSDLTLHSNWTALDQAK